MKSMYTYLDLYDELQELTGEEKNWFFTTCQDCLKALGVEIPVYALRAKVRMLWESVGRWRIRLLRLRKKRISPLTHTLSMNAMRQSSTVDGISRLRHWSR